MKELSIEEKAKRYELALERCRKLYNEAKANGYTTDMEDYKTIFPEELKELKESKDEKTKRILHSISSKMSFHLRDIFTEEEFQCFDAWSYAWLKNQGKHDMGISEATKQKLEDNLNKALEKETPESCNKFLEMQGEQKLAWSEEDERFLNVATNILNASKVYTKSPDKYEDTINWLNSLKGRVGCEVKCTTTKEWSEKDERVRIALFLFVEAYGAYANYEVTQEEMLSWLESLKDRVQSQNYHKPYKRIKPITEV